MIILGEIMGSVSTSIRGVRFTLYTLGGNEWFRFPRHSVSGSTLLGLTWDSWCGKGTAPGCAWCLRGAMLLHTVAIQGRDIRDAQPSNEAELQTAIISMIPIPGGSQDAGGQLVRDLLVEFLKGFSLRTLLFLLDMVLPQLDAYHAGRHLQHLQPWASVELMQQQLRGQRGTNMHLTYQYEGYAGFHALQLHTDGAPVLLFCASTDLPQLTPKELCDAGRLGNMEANVMAGRALLAVLHLSDAQCRCVLLLVHEKVLQGGTSKTPEQRAFRRISPKYLDLCAVSLPIAKSFCGSLLQRYLARPEWRISIRCKIGRSP